jgi:hypothetical protein
MANHLTNDEELSYSVLFERPARPFHTWLSFRCRSWPDRTPDEVGLPAFARDEVGSAICYMMEGYLNYAKQNFGMNREDYEIWFVDRIAKIFMRLKNYGDSGVDPDCKYSVPGWSDVKTEWPPKVKIFDVPAGSPVPFGVVLHGTEAERFEAEWAAWTGGPISIVPDEFPGGRRHEGPGGGGPLDGGPGGGRDAVEGGRGGGLFGGGGRGPEGSGPSLRMSGSVRPDQAPGH